jgi:Zn-dependent protease
MSWQDREAGEDPMRRFGRPGGDWRGLRPTFDNPMSWALTIGRVAGITVRVHVLFLIFVAVELLQPAFGTTRMLFADAVLMIVILFWIVLLHEFGHCIACRLTGGDADEILIWPLGGLAFCRPEHRASAHLATALGGPAVNVAILAVLAPVLGTATGTWWGVAVPNPLGLHVPADVADSWALRWLFLANAMNLLLLLFNMLLPMFPFDGGRVVQAVLWPPMGYARSMRVAVYCGYVGAIALGILGMVMKEPMVLAIAIFGFVTCAITQRQLEFTEQALGFPAEAIDEPRPSARRQRREERRAAREQREFAAIDAILRKIRARGMGSLTGSEKRRLRRATERKRRDSD